MNLRHLKKREKRAKKELIKRGILSDADFSPADGSESVYAPDGLHNRYCFRGFVKGLMKGTPVIWYRVGYYDEEWECELPSTRLSEYDWTPEDWWDPF